VYIALRPREKLSLSISSANFLTTTTPPVRFAHLPGSLSQPKTSPSLIIPDSPKSLGVLESNKIMMIDFPHAVIFDFDGVEVSKIPMEMPSIDFLESSGLDRSAFGWIESDISIRNFAITVSGDIYSLFYKKTPGRLSSDPGLLLRWNIAGKLVSVEHIGPLFVQYSHLGTHGQVDWLLSSSGDSVLVSSSAGVFMIIDPVGQKRTGILEFIGSDAYFYPGMELYENAIYTVGAPGRYMKYGLDGSLDWVWLGNSSPLFQPSGAWSAFQPGSAIAGLFLLPNRETVATVPSGFARIKPDGSYAIVGDSSGAGKMKDMTNLINSSFLRCIPRGSGWLIIPSINYPAIGTYPELILANGRFEIEKTIQLTVSPYETDSEDSDESSPVASQSQIQIGDIAYLELASQDFHPIPGGYRAIDHSGLRVITTDGNLVVKGIFDRTNPQSGLYQKILACRVDSRGYYYILGPAPGFQTAPSGTVLPQYTGATPGLTGIPSNRVVQVLDPNGHYVRRHAELGIDLFGTAQVPMDIQLDSFDRLWIISPHRFYVIDRMGNLARIFEQRNAPYSRAPQAGSSMPPTEDTFRGYTVTASSDPFSRDSDTQKPVVLNAGDISSVALGRGAARAYFYISDNASNQIVGFDWNGREIGSIDLNKVLNAPDEYRIATDSAGYLYLLEPGWGKVHVYDPLLKESHTIELKGFPGTGWGKPSLLKTFPRQESNKCFINESTQLVVVLVDTKDLLVFDLIE